MSIDELLTHYSPVTFYATDRGVRLDFGWKSFPGATVEEAVAAFLAAMQSENKLRKETDEHTE